MPQGIERHISGSTGLKAIVRVPTTLSMTELQRPRPLGSAVVMRRPRPAPGALDGPLRDRRGETSDPPADPPAPPPIGCETATPQVERPLISARPRRWKMSIG